MLEIIQTLSAIALITLLSLPLLIPKFTTWLKTSKSTLLQTLRLQQKDTQTTEIISLRIYPIKSCRGLQLNSTKLTMQGLELDRRWMLIDAKTTDFLTIRQIPEMTLINTALSEDGQNLLVTFTGAKDKQISIPTHPDPTWLEANTTLSQVKIWDIETDGYVYGADINEPFSAFLGRDVCLVYKGPTPRVMRGNGDPRLLGRTQSVNFPDVHPVLIASEASISELNAQLVKNGAEAITIERFRPNIIVRGSTPWSEDSWKVVRIGGGGAGEVGKPLDIDVVARCTRCQVPNVTPDTGEKHKNQPWDTLMSYRRIDEGMRYKPCFGMLCAPRGEGVVEVGMRFDVLEETGSHQYIKGF
ncbi:MOSC N-terminal beta barrel domain-containing protein [Aspergillus leporis]|uniref:MOSC N-terminal beta barrel domain-containing protein n=1 Tax=Aspergillus leporis TaxID=41062 RepID=A0A5N5X1R4_9EURO|nr:MOSC N-terminal beta barrel domain-containing protein [Aspergillus leporis]